MFTLVLAPGGRRTVVVCDPAVIREVFTGSDTVFHAGWGNEFLRPVMGDRSVLVVNGDEHRALRRALVPTLHGEALRGYARAIGDLAADEVDGWPVGRPVPLHPRMNALSLEIILRVVFGVASGPRLEQLRPLLATVLAVDSLTLLCGSYPKLRFLPRWRAFAGVLAAVDRLVYEEIAERRREPGLAERQDVLSRLLATDRGRPDADLRDQLITLLLAGYDTTGAALAWALHELAHHDAARAEAQRAADTGDDAYLTAVFKESVRRRPVFYEVARTLTQPVEVGGWKLPAGVSVMPAIGVVHGDPAVYERPDEFRPERFLNGSAGASWIPFGGGARRCLGAGFAQAEAVLVLKEVLRRYDLVPPLSGRPEAARSRNVTYAPERGATLVLSRRERTPA